MVAVPGKWPTKFVHVTDKEGAMGTNGPESLELSCLSAMRVVFRAVPVLAFARNSRDPIIRVSAWSASGHR